MPESFTGTFLRRDGARAVVQIDGEEKSLRNVGYYLPRPGDTVRITRDGGEVIVDGPAIPKEPRGVIETVGASRLDDGRYVPIVSVRTTDGQLHEQLDIGDHITDPQWGDVVMIDWPSGGTVFCRFAPKSNDEGLAPSASTVLPSETIVRPTWSARYFNGSLAADDNPWCSDNNSAAWGGYDFTGIGDILRIEMFLPSTQQQFAAPSIGTHTAVTKPSSEPAASALVMLPGRNGWSTIRDDGTGMNVGWAESLRAGGGLIIPARNGTFDKWSGITGNADSGALRIITRS